MTAYGRKSAIVILFLLKFFFSKGQTPFGSDWEQDQGKALPSGYINVLDLGADNTGRTETSSKIQAAIDEALSKKNPNIIIPEGTYLTNSLQIRSGQHIFIRGKLISNSRSGLLNISDCTESKVIGLEGGELLGNSHDTSSGITISNSSGIEVRGLKISGFRNKGINLSGRASEIKVSNNIISGGSSSTGAGISIWGTVNVHHCLIEHNYISDSRVAITINGGSEITLSNNHLLNNRSAGIMLDGIVTRAGDGAKNCVVSENIIDSVSSTTFAAIYLGNGASNNTIKGNVIKRIASQGIRYSADTASVYSTGNLIMANQISNCKLDGITTLQMRASTISNNHISNCGRYGIYLIASDHNTVTSNYVTGIKNIGIYIQSSVNNVHGNTSTGNLQALKIAAYKTWPSENNIIENNDFSGNSRHSAVEGNNTVSNNKEEK
jgi:parallel beta-helix repeat protein